MYLHWTNLQREKQRLHSFVSFDFSPKSVENWKKTCLMNKFIIKRVHYLLVTSHPVVGMGPVKKHCKKTYLFLTLGKLKDLFFLWKNVVSLAVSLVTLEERLKFPPLELEPFFVPAKVTWGLWLFAKIDFSNLAIFSSREIKALPPSWSESTPVSLRLLTWK